MRLLWNISLIALLLAAISLQQSRCYDLLLDEDTEFHHNEFLDDEADEEAEAEVIEHSPPAKDLSNIQEILVESSPSTSPKASSVPATDLQVIQLTSRTFKIARHYHSQPQLKVKIARVNVEQERALALRFGVNSFPSFYVIDQWSAYQFEQPRSKKNLMEFVSGKYKKQEPLPFHSSPMGPMGLAQGALVNGGLQLSNVFYWLQDKFGLSSLVAGTLMFGTFFSGCFFCIVFCAIALTPKAKVD